MQGFMSIGSDMNEKWKYGKYKLDSMTYRWFCSSKGSCIAIDETTKWRHDKRKRRISSN